MKRNLNTLLLSMGVLCFSGIESKAQITLLKDYQNYTSAPIGTYKGINYREAGFSSLYAIPGTNGKEFWTISDRGVNIDCGNANLPDCRPGYDKMYAFPSYAPKIHRIRVSGDSVQILQTISMKRPDGTGATGLLNPTGFGSLAKESNPTDTVSDCANLALKTVPKDVWGIDSEGLVVDKDGNFWISEEGGPTIWKLNKNGVVVKRFTPYAPAQSQDVQIDSVFKYRKNNRGFEALAITPNGKLYALIQSPLLFPTKAVGEATQVHRLLEIDLATNATRVLVYLNEGVIGASGSNQIRLQDWKIGDMAAINDSTFLVIEAALRGTSDIKNIYKINITGATAVTASLYGTKTVEGLSTADSLAKYDIKPVKKTLFLDLKANGWPSTLDKSEGLAIINDSTIAVSNDNDYGQECPAADGLATATGKLSHVVVYGLKGANKLQHLFRQESILAEGQTGPSSSATPYLTPLQPGVKFTSLLTVGDAVGGYKMVGIPDGLGAFDNGNGTFTLLMNHEITGASVDNVNGVARAHGGKGAFVSKWVINKADLSVVSGSDLIHTVKLWDSATSAYKTFAPGDTSKLKNFLRFCSADLPAVSAFYDAKSGKGTVDRIFMNGEEYSDERGRAFAHVVTGTEANTTYELPRLGKAAWENSVANPASGLKTVVGLMNDGTDGQVYIYVGTKTDTGSVVSKAGLTNGKIFGIKVPGYPAERTNSTTVPPLPIAGTRFELADLGNVENTTGVAFNTASNTALVTKFSRPEDGAWDPSRPNDFYFATTDQIDQVNDGVGPQVGRSKLWRLRFDDVTTPETGGIIEAVLDGTEGQNMLDNITIDHYGHVLMVEDVGNSVHNGKTWQYNIAKDELKIIAMHDSTRFGNVGKPAAAPFNVDEEASGVLDAQEVLGRGMFLVVDQAHYAIPGELQEGGQLLAFFNPDTYNSTAIGQKGPNSSATPYLTPLETGVNFTSIFTVGDTVKGYKMVGIPDGLGAYDNHDGTFTLLMNHEITGASVDNVNGVARAHGGKGAFVSQWVIKKSDLSVLSGSDLIHTVKLWDPTISSYKTFGPTDTTKLKNFLRFCSADLPAVSAFYDAKSGKGTMDRIFMNGEEYNDERGRAFGHVATGTEAGTTYELPRLGKAAWENSVANPASGLKTVVGLMNDGTDGQVYIYVGTKVDTGSVVSKAGLTNGKIYGVKVPGYPVERTNSTTVPPLPIVGTRFELADLGNVENTTGVAFNTASNTALVTKFSRPEDGAWDPSRPNDFYFATTDQIDQVNDGVGAQVGRSKLWRLRFDDAKNPETGGVIEAVLDGTEGQNMLDNITIDQYGHVLLVEDVGNSVHNGKTWQYTIATDELKKIAQHDTARFGDVGIPAKAPFNVDEEASGILDAQEVLGAGMFLVVDQAHYSIPGELQEGGQLLAFFNPDTYNAHVIVTDMEDVYLSNSSDVYMFPNPTNNTATISMNLEKASKVVVTIFDTKGSPVAPAIEQNLLGGKQQMVLDTEGLENGIYFIQVATGAKTIRIKAVIMH